jgi:hypothetical protein
VSPTENLLVCLHGFHSSLVPISHLPHDILVNSVQTQVVSTGRQLSTSFIISLGLARCNLYLVENQKGSMDLIRYTGHKMLMINYNLWDCLPTWGMDHCTWQQETSHHCNILNRGRIHGGSIHSKTQIVADPSPY